MNKITFLLLFLPVLALCQPVSQLDSLLNQLNTEISNVNPDNPKFDNLIATVKALSEDVKSRKESSPTPNSKDGVTYWTDLALVLWEHLPALLVTLLTAIWGKLLKRDPEKAVTAIQKFFSQIKTRWVIVASSVVATVVGMVFFKEGAWTIPAAVYYLITSLLAGIGIAEVLDWINVKLLVKKQA